MITFLPRLLIVRCFSFLLLVDKVYVKSQRRVHLNTDTGKVTPFKQSVGGKLAIVPLDDSSLTISSDGSLTPYGIEAGEYSLNFRSEKNADKFQNYSAQSSLILETFCNIFIADYKFHNLCSFFYLNFTTRRNCFKVLL